MGSERNETYLFADKSPIGTNKVVEYNVDGSVHIDYSDSSHWGFGDIPNRSPHLSETKSHITEEKRQEQPAVSRPPLHMTPTQTNLFLERYKQALTLTANTPQVISRRKAMETARHADANSPATKEAAKAYEDTFNRQISYTMMSRVPKEMSTQERLTYLHETMKATRHYLSRQVAPDVYMDTRETKIFLKLFHHGLKITTLSPTVQEAKELMQRELRRSHTTKSPRAIAATDAYHAEFARYDRIWCMSGKSAWAWLGG